MLHPPREVRLRRLDEEMIVVRHQAVGVTDPSKPFNERGKRVEKASPVGVVEEDLRPRVPAACDVIDCAFVFDPQRASHEPRVAFRALRIKI